MPGDDEPLLEPVEGLAALTHDDLEIDAPQAEDLVDDDEAGGDGS